MGRIIALDYGIRRTGIAVTDPYQLIANALTTIETKELYSFLKSYFLKEEVESIVIGLPKKLDGSDTDATSQIKLVITQLKDLFPEQHIFHYDERFTSKLAMQTLIQAGTTKKFRRQKGNIDKISAVIILQDWMESQRK